MGFNDIKDYWISKLLFPKTFIVDKPGIIINCVARKYGNESCKLRAFFDFEEIAVNLQLETVKKLGEKKANELWYRIGKEIGYNYMMLSNIKKIPSFLLPSVLKHIFEGFKNGGQSFAEKIVFSSKSNELILSGKDNIICRKSKNGNFGAGIVSGVLSFLTKKNIEAGCFCSNCPRNCKIIASPKIKQKYIVDEKRLAPDGLYSRLNFPKNVSFPNTAYSFSDLVRFKKIKLDESGKWSIENNFLIPGEIRMTGVIFDNFARYGLKDFFCKSIIKSAEKIAANLLLKEKRPSKRLQIILSIFCALGNGIPTYSITKECVYIQVMFAPYSEYGFLYLAMVLNGFVNAALGKKFKLEKINFNEVNSSLILVFS